MDDADFQGADLSDANLAGAILDNADLRFANMSNTGWNGIRSIKGANIYGEHNPPQGFVDWALKHGAVQTKPEEDSD